MATDAHELQGLRALVTGGTKGIGRAIAGLDDSQWQRALDLNLFATVCLDRALLPSMLEQRSGVIVHITSIQSRMPLPDATIAYAAAKAALAGSRRMVPLDWSMGWRPRGAPTTTEHGRS